MVNVEGLAWAHEVMGEPGPYVRESIPDVLTKTHSRYVALQATTELADATPYGLMWLGVPKALTAMFRDLAGVQLHRPKRGRYHLPLVNGVPIIPWRYAKDGKTDLKDVPFGRPVSATRQALFSPPDMAPELPLGEVGLGDAVLDDLSDEQREQVNAYGTDVRSLATDRLAGVLAYASNPDALLNGYFGYAVLGVDGLLDWKYIEELPLTSYSLPLREVGPPAGRPAFNAGPMEQPKLRPRSKTENPSDDGTPPTAPTGTNE